MIINAIELRFSINFMFSQIVYSKIYIDRSTTIMNIDSSIHYLHYNTNIL